MLLPGLSGLVVFCAGSLRHAVADFAASRKDIDCRFVFGPAGLLRRRIEDGEQCDLFLSADLGHPQALASRFSEARVVAFAGNAIVAVAQQKVGLRQDNLLETLLQPWLRIGTSTPGADPGGDYAMAVFDRAGRLRPGADRVLRAKAQHLVGGESSVVPARLGHPIEHFLAEDIVDVFLCYATTARVLTGRIDVVVLPQELRVDAIYGLLVTAPDPVRQHAAEAFAASLMSAEARSIFAKRGFIDVVP